MRIVCFRAKALREVRGVACADVAQRSGADLSLLPLAQGATAVGFLCGAARFAIVLTVTEIGGF